MIRMMPRQQHGHDCAAPSRCRRSVNCCGRHRIGLDWSVAVAIACRRYLRDPSKTPIKRLQRNIQVLLDAVVCLDSATAAIENAQSLSIAQPIPCYIALYESRRNRRSCCQPAARSTRPLPQLVHRIRGEVAQSRGGARFRCDETRPPRRPRVC